MTKVKLELQETLDFSDLSNTYANSLEEYVLQHLLSLGFTEEQAEKIILKMIVDIYSDVVITFELPESEE